MSSGLYTRSRGQSDRLSSDDVTVESCGGPQRQSPVASLDWDAHLDAGPLLSTSEPPPTRPPASSVRMTSSDLANGNFGDVTSDDETEQLIGQIDAMTQRTLAETGAVIGFIDEP